MPDNLIKLDFQPGTQRDGTRVDAQRYLDALWCRFRLGRPRKMGGYREIANDMQGVPRRIHEFFDGVNTYVHIGTSQGIQQIVLDRANNVVSSNNRTPMGFPGGPNVGWTIDSMFDTTSSNVLLLCHAAADLQDVSDPTKAPPFIGNIVDPSQLGQFSTPTYTQMSYGTYDAPNVAGGVVCVQPFLFSFDSAGHVWWSPPNQPNLLGVSGGYSGAGQARISAQKIVWGAPARGGGANSPAVLFWTLSELILGSFVGQSAGSFAWTTVSPSSSILSSDCVIEYDSVYYWAAFERFLMYNGTVQEVPNQQNMDWFFNNINRQYAARSFAMKFPRWGEIWFCAPLFGATEPSHAVIYNVREGYWYDTALPDGGRSAGYFAQGTRYPIMGGSTLGSSGYSIWLHEYGFDSVDIGGTPTPVRSYFETPFLGGPKLDQPNNNSLSFNQIEPDHIQVGEMSVHVVGGFNALSSETADDAVSIAEIPQNPIDQIPGLNTSRRLGRLHFESNTMGGNYIVGRSLLHGDEADDTMMPGGVGTPLTRQQ